MRKLKSICYIKKNFSVSFFLFYKKIDCIEFVENNLFKIYCLKVDSESL